MLQEFFSDCICAHFRSKKVKLGGGDTLRNRPRLPPSLLFPSPQGALRSSSHLRQMTSKRERRGRGGERRRSFQSGSSSSSLLLPDGKEKSQHGKGRKQAGCFWKSQEWKEESEESLVKWEKGGKSGQDFLCIWSMLVFGLPNPWLYSSEDLTGGITRTLKIVPFAQTNLHNLSGTFSKNAFNEGWKRRLRQVFSTWAFCTTCNL